MTTPNDSMRAACEAAITLVLQLRGIGPGTMREDDLIRAIQEAMAQAPTPDETARIARIILQAGVRVASQAKAYANASTEFGCPDTQALADECTRDAIEMRTLARKVDSAAVDAYFRELA